MMQSFYILECALQEFHDKKQEFTNINIRQQTDHELLSISKIVKKEVIDLGDTMDLMAEVINR